MANTAFPELHAESSERSGVGDLLRRDRLASVGALAAGIAQEVANPLTYVTGALESLRGRLRSGETLGEESLSLVGDLLDATRRANALVQDLSALTAAPGASAPDLPEMIHAAARVASTMTSGSGVQLTTGAVPAAPGGGDPLTGQVALWLALAGIRAARSEARLEVHVDGSAFVLVVTHDGPAGPGDPGALDRAVCGSLATLLGGAMREGSPASPLRVTLPATRTGAKAEPAWPSPRGRVLVIDDDAAVAEVLAVRLEQSWSVDICTDPVRALSLLRAAGPWDAVVCDVRMEPLSGPDLYARLCSEAPAWRDRFVFVSAGVPSPDEVGIMREGGCPLLSKPNTLHRLLDAVEGRITRGGAAKPRG